MPTGPQSAGRPVVLTSARSPGRARLASLLPRHADRTCRRSTGRSRSERAWRSSPACSRSPRHRCGGRVPHGGAERSGGAAQSGRRERSDHPEWPHLDGRGRLALPQRAARDSPSRFSSSSCSSRRRITLCRSLEKVGGNVELAQVANRERVITLRVTVTSETPLT
jgi:hypothetical protein